MKAAETTGWLTFRRLTIPIAAFKVLVDEDTDQIPGAQLLSPNAGEVINPFRLAMPAKLPANEVKQLIFS